MLSDDTTCIVLLCCVTFGVGSLSMTEIFAAMGPLVGTLALYGMAAWNLQASLQISKCMKATPPYVRTFGDLGYFVAGKWGQYWSNITQITTCLCIPLAYLVLVRKLHLFGRCTQLYREPRNYFLN